MKKRGFFFIFSLGLDSRIKRFHFFFAIRLGLRLVRVQKFDTRPATRESIEENAQKILLAKRRCMTRNTVFQTPHFQFLQRFSRKKKLFQETESDFALFRSTIVSSNAETFGPMRSSRVDRFTGQIQGSSLSKESLFFIAFESKVNFRIKSAAREYGNPDSFKNCVVGETTFGHRLLSSSLSLL
jgi:hypothetical protein